MENNQLNKNKKLLLDVGGTFIKCSDGRSIPIDSDGSREQISAALREAAADYPVLRIAIPGPFNYDEGIFMMKHKFAAVYGAAFTELLGREADCRFIHDVNCMLLGELGPGNRNLPDRGKDCPGTGDQSGCEGDFSGTGNPSGCEGDCPGNVALIALGTGLGFAMSVDGNILRNAAGSPAVSIYNRPFRDGILEDYASKRGMLRLYAEEGGPYGLTVKEISGNARRGDEKALRAFSRMGAIIGRTIAPILQEYGTQRLLLGGQISRSADLFLPALEKEIAEVRTLQKVSAISDFDNATFNGLKVL